jgi:hypothetical protein
VRRNFARGPGLEPGGSRIRSVEVLSAARGAVDGRWRLVVPAEVNIRWISLRYAALEVR